MIRLSIVVKLFVVAGLCIGLFGCNGVSSSFDKQEYQGKIEKMSDEELKQEYQKFTKE